MWQDRIPTLLETLDWSKERAPDGEAILPIVVQHRRTGQVLMLGYVSRAALQETAIQGELVFHSRSKGRLWRKGESSGNTLAVHDIALDCDADALVALVEPHGPTCHLGTPSCFGGCAPAVSVLGQLNDTIRERLQGDDAASYVRKLVRSGLDRVLKKLGEETTELILEAKNVEQQKAHARQAFANESADLIFHWLILCETLECSPEETFATLAARVGAPRRE